MYRWGLLAVGVVVIGAAAWIIYRDWHYRSLFNRGKTHFSQDYYLDALEDFQACLELRPGDANAMFWTARAARRNGLFELADSLLTHCQEKLPPSDLLGLERVLLRANRGEVDAVEKYCLRLLEQNHPDSPLIREALIKGFMNSFRWGEALKHVAHWLKDQPDHPQPLYLYGLIDFQGGNLQEPRVKFRRVLELDPKRRDVRALLAEVLIDLGLAQEALPHLQELQRHKPDDPLLQTRWAICLDMLGRQNEAREHLEEVWRLHPHFPLALVEGGKLALRAGNLPEAEKFLQKACERSPGDKAAHYQLLQCLRLQQKTEAAQVVLQRLNQIQEDNARLQLITSQLLARTPNNPALHVELGKILLRAGAVKEGLRWLNSALQLDPHFGPAHQALADHFQTSGQLGRAARHRQLAQTEAAKKP